MIEVTLKKNDISATFLEPDGESTEEFIDLISQALSWIEEKEIVLGDVQSDMRGISRIRKFLNFLTRLFNYDGSNIKEK